MSKTNPSHESPVEGRLRHTLYDIQPLRRIPYTVYRILLRCWRKNWLYKAVMIVCLLAAVSLGAMYGIARWYIHEQSSKPLELGATFVPDYASSLGLDPQATLHAILGDLGVRQLRLTSYWSDIEPAKGQYNFSTLDWEFAAADAAHAKVSLSIGLRQPRWPECHPPNWINTSQPDNQWLPQLKSYMRAVIERYKSNPALDSYQLENEFFNSFGQCNNFDRNRLVGEFGYVKDLDPKHPIIISRSNNYGGLPVGAPTPDEFGISVYRRVWTPLLKRYIEYPFPAWYYGFLAGAQQILTGKNSVLHELQAEPWPPAGKGINQISIAEENKSLSPERFTQTVQFGEATGMRRIYLWGAEFWYYRKVKQHDPDLWNAARKQFAAARAEDAQAARTK